MHYQQFYMQQALMLAKRGWLTVSPNPMVGCVIVKQGQIIGEGFHEKPGQAHAEINALKQAGQAASGSDVYVTLEPCCHDGKTPPCVDALIHARVKRVIIASIDPNPSVSGKGIDQLKAHGIKVIIGVCQTQAEQLNQIFFYYQKTKCPFVISKWAMSADGYLTTAKTDTRQITGQSAWRTTHAWRHRCDAILIGRATLQTDQPALTARLIESGPQPQRIVVSYTANIDPNMPLFQPNQSPIIFVTHESQINKPACQAIKAQGHIVWGLVSGQSPQTICLLSLLQRLGDQGISSLLVEGGSQIHAAFFQAGLVNQIQGWIAPCIIGGVEQKQFLNQPSVQLCGRDWQITGEMEH